MRRSVLFPFQLTSVAHLAEVAELCEQLAFDRLWLPQSLGVDAWCAIAAIAARVPTLSFGTAVALMPLYHPLEFALRLRAMGELLPGRFVAGVGVSEPAVVEQVLGERFPGSALRYAREYVRVVETALREPPTEISGEYFSVLTNDQRNERIPLTDLPEMVLAALGPRMAALAGEVAEGCIAWLAPPELLARDIVASFRTSTTKAGSAVGVVAVVPCIPLTSREQVSAIAERMLAVHLSKPHYRKMLARMPEAATSASMTDIVRFVVDNVVAWGTSADIDARLREYEQAGADEIVLAAYGGIGTPPGMFRRTLELARPEHGVRSLSSNDKPDAGRVSGNGGNRRWRSTATR